MIESVDGEVGGGLNKLEYGDGEKGGEEIEVKKLGLRRDGNKEDVDIREVYD